MGPMRLMVFAGAALISTTIALSQTAETAQSCLGRLSSHVDILLQKEQPPLFAWHLHSLKALALSEYSKLALPVHQTRRLAPPDRTKEFIEFIDTIDKGLVAYGSNPDSYLKDGTRTLILARTSDIEGSLQYMMVDLPKDWDPNHRYPLFISLHGSGPDNPLAYPSYTFGAPTPPKPGASPNPTDGMVHLTPWGRGNRGWRNDAERDLFEALTLLQTFAKVDPDRWYISGHSSGADGCWAILQHTPDLWAAAGIQSGSMVSGRPEWGLIPNMAYVPVYFLIGEKDPLAGRVPDMKEAFKIMTKLHDETQLVILPGVGHYPLTEEGVNTQSAWMVSHIRKRPSHFIFTVDEAIHPGVWGIRIPFNGGNSRLIQQPWPSFECDIKEGEVRIKTKRIKELRVDLGSSGLQMTGSVKLWVNGKLAFEGPIPSEPVTVTKI